MAKKWSRKFMFEWWRDPLSPITQSWELPLLEDAFLKLLREKFGFTISYKPTKVFNGYLYLTANYVDLVVRLSAFKLIWNLITGIRDARNEWEEQVSIHLDELEKSKTRSIQKVPIKGLYLLCNEVLKNEARYFAWSLYVGIYSLGLEYLFSRLFPLFIKGYKKFDYKQLLIGFYNKSLEVDVDLWRLGQHIQNDDNLERVFLEKNSEKILQELKQRKYQGFQKKFVLWLDTYGHMIQDLDLIYPTLKEQPEIVVSMLKQLLIHHPNDPITLLKARELKRKETEKQMLKNIRWWFPFGRTVFKKFISITQLYFCIREDRSFYYQGQILARKILLELGSRLRNQGYLKNPKDIFFLTKEELRCICQNNLILDTSVIEKRKNLYEKQKQLSPPTEIMEPFDGTFPKKNKKRLRTDDEIIGTGASPGKVAGMVKIIFSQEEFHKFRAGEILVTRATSPSWTPLITLAAGVVTDIGGVLCHAAIISRELQIPAVVDTEKASLVLKDGDYVIVDGNEGLVKIINKSAILNYEQKESINERSKQELSRIETVREINNKRRKFILPISAVTKKDKYLVGGKGANLGELISIGLNVPRGFILTTEMYGRNILEFKDQIFREFAKLNTTFVAVRSSATAEDSPKDSFAGQFQTYLNVTRRELLEAIQKCWESINQPRVIEYCRRKKIARDKVKVAVIIQKMIQPDVSGICFSADPVTKCKNNLIIEAVYGLGESLVSGNLTPDSYLVNKESLKIIKKKITKQEFQLKLRQDKNVEQRVPTKMQSKRKLENKQITLLAKAVILAEKHYAQPLDVEWVFKERKLYIVQARPITNI